MRLATKVMLAEAANAMRVMLLAAVSAERRS